MSIAAVIGQARVLAEIEGATAVTPTHLALAILSDQGSRRSELIVERGGYGYRQALRRVSADPPPNPDGSEPTPPPYRSSMRLSLLVLTVAFGRLVELVTVRVLGLSPAGSPDRPPLTQESRDVVRLARSFAVGVGQGDESAGDQLLLALLSRPGRHLKVLPNATVLACAVRKELGIATRRHRLILACDGPKRWTRRVHMRLNREVAAHGRLSRWGLASLGYGALGVCGAVVVTIVGTLTMGLLYLFLWPAALLMSGVRTLSGKIFGCDTRSYHWLEVPGGDVAVTPNSQAVSPRAVTLALLVPRMVALLLALAVMTVLLWRTSSLGVSLAPVVMRRPDVVTGAAAESIWVGPISILAGMLQENGKLAGVGLLAGLGAAVMSIPTFREVELVRLHAGHDARGGSRSARLLTGPASFFTGGVACLEALLPFTGAPIYATAYAVPLLIAVLVGAAVVQALPY